jgi:hypothetical protein
MIIFTRKTGYIIVVWFVNILFSLAVRAQTITTTGLSGSTPYCNGAAINVTYSITGTFTAGNVFTAQLSNITGSFASSTVNIGTRTATTGGTINATLPFTVATGTLYRIRVISSTPALLGADNGFNITINSATISAPTISATSFCQGQTFSLTFTKTCNFSNTPSANIFTAQLSNASGSFASPTAIGTLTSTNSGTISATIPAGTPAGTGYRIRVVSSNPSITGPNNGTNLTISAGAGTPGVFGNGTWNVYCFNQFNNFSNNYYGYYTENNLSFNTTTRWGNNAGPGVANSSSGLAYNGCPMTSGVQYSVAYLRTNIPCGYYRIDIPTHDDYAYLIINGTTLWSHVGCCDAHTNVYSGFIKPTDQIEIRFTNSNGPGFLSATFTLVTPLVMSAPVTVCASTSTNLTVTNTSMVALTYSWAPAATLSPTTGNTVTATPTATTTYTVTGTDAISGCTVTNTVLVTVNPVPTTAVMSTTTTICSGITSSTLTATGANTYTWSPATGLNTASGNVVIATPTVTTTYTVTGSNNCSSVNATTTVTVQVIPVSPSPTTFGNGEWNVYCYNDLTFGTYYGYYTETNLSFNSSTRWNTNNPSNANALTGMAYSGCTVVPLHSTIHKRTNFTCGYYQLNIPRHDDNVTVLIDGVQVYQHIGCCDAHTNVWTGFLGPTTTVEIRQSNNGGGGSYIEATFINIPFPSLSPPVTICATSNTTLTATPIPGANFAWTSPIMTDIASPSSTSTIVTPIVSTTYTCTVTDPGTTCSAAATVLVTVDPLPSTSVTPASATVNCAIQTYTLTATGANTYTWAPSAGLSATTGNSVIASPTVTTTYTVTGNNNCASNTDSSIITVVPLINPSVFPSTTWNVYCYGDQNFTNYYGYYTENGSGASGYNFNTTTRWASGAAPSTANATNGLAYRGCTMPTTNWSMRFRRTGFACGLYTINILGHDDNFTLIINGVQVAQHNGSSDTHNSIWIGALNSTSTVEFRLVQGGGGSNLSVSFVPASSSTTQAVWIGAASSDWFTVENWCGGGGVIPDQTKDVIIPSAGPQFMPVIGSAGAACKSLTINPGVTASTFVSAIPPASLSMTGGFGLDVHGNWTNGGTLSAGTGTVRFLGTSPVTMSSVSAQSFYNVVVNCANLTQSSGTTNILNSMNLINGIITQNGTLQFQNGSTVTGASNASHVDGFVVKIGSNAFTFPVGSGGIYRPITISAPALVTDNFTAKYFIGNPHTAYPTLTWDAVISNFSSCEYWILNRTAGTSNVNVTLSWITNSCVVNNLPDLLVARWDAGLNAWKSHGNGGTTGDTSAGTIITSAPVTNFSPFTLASSTVSNPLPVELLYFDATLSNTIDLVHLNWATATERNNAFFTVERSSDGLSWIPILTKDGAINSSSQITYHDQDVNPLEGTSYYRLKQTDLNGDFSYSAISVIENSNIAESYFQVFPNPTKDKITISYAKLTSLAQLTITDNLGRKVLEVELDEGSTSKEIDLLLLPQGVYFLSIQGIDGVTKFLKYEE